MLQEMGPNTGDGAVKEDSKRNSGERGHGHGERMPWEGSRCYVEGHGQQIRAQLPLNTPQWRHNHEDPISESLSQC